MPRLPVLALACALALPLTALGQPRLISPLPGETVHSNNGEVWIAVIGAPGEVWYRAVLDGTPVGAARREPGFTITGVERGTHRVAVQLLDGRGEVVADTEAVEFHLWQASRLFPGRAR